MGLSPEQLAQRLNGISATDVSAIIGVNPYRSRIDVWREKRGDAPPWVDSDRSIWGELLEPVIRRNYAERRNVRVEVMGTLAISANHGGPLDGEAWMMATPDGIAYPYAGADPSNGLEIKCHTWRVAHLYGEPGTDEIPLWELCQVAWNLAVTGLERWDLVAFIDGQPEDYTVMRDDELIGGLITQCERFLVDNVRGGEPPEPDGSASFDAWLKGRWASNPGALIDVAGDPEVMALVERGRKLREAAADAEKEIDQLVQQLKARIGDHEGMCWPNAKGKTEKLTWKRNKASARIDYAGIANDARADARLAASGHGATFERALICLRSLDHASIGTSTRAAITAHEVAELLAAVQGTLMAIASRTDAGYTTTTPGNRPFCWPRTWKAPTEKKEH